MLTHELRAYYLAGLGIGYDLHKAAAWIGDKRSGVAKHYAFAGFCRYSRFPGLGLRHSYHRYLGPAVYDAGHNVHIHAVLYAVHHIDACCTLCRGNVGKLNLRGYIAYGVHPGYAGLILLVYLYAPTVHLGREALCKQAVHIGFAAYGTEHSLAGYRVVLALFTKAHREAAFVLLHALYHGVNEHIHALFFKYHGEVLAELAVHIGQQPVHALYDGHLAAEVAVECGEFYAYHAAANYYYGLVQMVAALQQLVGSHYTGKVQPGYRRAGRYGTRSGDYLFRRQFIAAALVQLHMYAAGSGYLGAPPDQVYLCALKKALYAGAELSGYLPLVGKYLVHIRTRTFNMYANAGAGCGSMICLGGMEQRLCGYAASIEACAASLPVFHHRNRHSQLSGAQRGHIASGTCAYHYQLVFLHKY